MRVIIGTNLSKEDQQLVEQYIQLLKCKGVYMYKYTNPFARFQETELPPQKDFI